MHDTKMTAKNSIRHWICKFIDDLGHVCFTNIRAESKKHATKIMADRCVSKKLVLDFEGDKSLYASPYGTPRCVTPYAA